MKWWGRKPGLSWRILVILCFAASSMFNYMDYRQERDKMDFFVCIVFGLGAIFNLVDLIIELREKKNNRESSTGV